jgi:fumarate hydratase class II
MLSDGCERFNDYLLKGLEPDRKRIENFLGRSLMLVTALIPVIGYDKAAEIARLAQDRCITLREAARALGYVAADEFDRLVDPYSMVKQVDSQ